MLSAEAGFILVVCVCLGYIAIFGSLSIWAHLDYRRGYLDARFMRVLFLIPVGFAVATLVALFL